jgi:hypothetical protein
MTKEARLRAVATAACELWCAYSAWWKPGCANLQIQLPPEVIAELERLGRAIKETQLEVEDLHP